MNNELEVAQPLSGSSSTWILVELEFGNVGFGGERQTGVPGEKPLGAKERTKNKINPHMASTPRFEPGPHWWEASALTTAPPLLPIIVVLAFKFNCDLIFSFIQSNVIFSYFVHYLA